MSVKTLKKFCEYKGPGCRAIAVHWNASENADLRGWYCEVCYKAIRKKQIGNAWKSN